MLKNPMIKNYEAQLSAMRTDVPWSVRNQARMHARNGDQPYLSSKNAMAHWLETPTCVGVKVCDGGALSVIAPYGVEDLLALEVRPTPSGVRKPDIYRDRIDKKGWLKSWAQLADILRGLNKARYNSVYSLDASFTQGSKSLNSSTRGNRSSRYAIRAA